MSRILHGPAIHEFLVRAAASSVELNVAAPFWGSDAIKLLGLDVACAASRKLICNLESGACNPAPIKLLQSDERWQMRTNSRLHAKVYIFDQCALVGSANPSANGLALENHETQSWHEVCSIVTDRKSLAELKNWFETLFDSPGSLRITRQRLRLSEQLWKRRRKDTADILKKTAKSLKQLAESDEGKSVLENAYVWIYRDDMVSRESISYVEELRKEYGGLTDPYEVPDDPRLYAYETVIDCFYRTQRDRPPTVSIGHYRLYPQLAKVLRSGEGKGSWTLPCGPVTRRDLDWVNVDQESKTWLIHLIRNKLKVIDDDWYGTLWELLESSRMMTD